MLSDAFDPRRTLKTQSVPGDESPTKEDPSKDLGIAFYEHPIIYRLAKKGKGGRPSYISKQNFAQVVIALLSDQNSIKQSFTEIETNIRALPNGGTKRLLLTLLAESEENVWIFRSKLEKWFDEMMDRATGWYKRWVQRVLLVIGFGLSALFNADTFQIAKTLSEDPEARAQVIGMAESFQQKYYLDSASVLRAKAVSLHVDVSDAQVTQVNTLVNKRNLGTDHFIVNEDKTLSDLIQEIRDIVN